MVCNVITADKANRLYWLGRYVERVYISLHLLRRYYDKVLDGKSTDFSEYYQSLDVECEGYSYDSEDLQISQLYNSDNICSIASSIDMANDNGIVLRRDITSESLSYLQMSQAHIKECAMQQEKNITALQPISDNMLAFFGSIDERVFDERIRKFLKIGRFIENLDLHIRFNYPFYRIEEVFLSLKEYINRDSSAVNLTAMKRLDELISEDEYLASNDQYKHSLLKCLNYLVVI